MTLTIPEAENILSRVFSAEIEGGKVSIVDDTKHSGFLAGPTVVLSVNTFNRVMSLMAKTSSMKIDAIKAYREAVPGTGLAEAKAAIEHMALLP